MISYGTQNFNFKSRSAFYSTTTDPKIRRHISNINHLSIWQFAYFCDSKISRCFEKLMLLKICYLVLQMLNKKWKIIRRGIFNMQFSVTSLDLNLKLSEENLSKTSLSCNYIIGAIKSIHWFWARCRFCIGSSLKHFYRFNLVSLDSLLFH